MGGIDILLLIILAAVTWSVASEGVWGAALTSLIVIFSGLLAMNFFEPVAAGLEGMGGLWWRGHCDIFALIGLFGLLVFGFRAATDHISPRFIMTNRLVYELGRWSAGLLAGYVTMAFLLTAMHTGPFPRSFWGFAPERSNLLNIVAPDRQWLGFTQWTSERTLKWGGYGKVFDGPRSQRPMGTPPNQIWPSFVIRYASRRQALASGAVPGGSASTSDVKTDQGSGEGPQF
ncbi:MAG: CvpA family protein [Planctomycetaceae bacterium]|nr:CvpA family protein [Planctomycetaceae bacterium]